MNSLNIDNVTIEYTMYKVTRLHLAPDAGVCTCRSTGENLSKHRISDVAVGWDPAKLYGEF